MPSMPSASSRCASAGVVDRVASARRPAPCSCAEQRGVHQRVVGDHGHAAQRHAPSRASPATACRAAARAAARARLSRAPCSASGRNELSSGGTASPRHSRAASAATTRPVCASVPGVGLISMFSAKPLRRQKRGDRFQAGQRLAGEGAAVPAAGVEPRQLGPACARRPCRWPVVVRSQRGVVQQERHAVGAELDVALEGAVAVRRAERGRRPACSRAPACRRRGARSTAGRARRHRHVMLRRAGRWPASNQCRCSGGGVQRHGVADLAAARSVRVDAHGEQRRRRGGRTPGARRPASRPSRPAAASRPRRWPQLGVLGPQAQDQLARARRGRRQRQRLRRRP